MKRAGGGGDWQWPATGTGSSGGPPAGLRANRSRRNSEHTCRSLFRCCAAAFCRGTGAMLQPRGVRAALLLFLPLRILAQSSSSLPASSSQTGSSSPSVSATASPSPLPCLFNKSYVNGPNIVGLVKITTATDAESCALACCNTQPCQVCSQEWFSAARLPVFRSGFIRRPARCVSP